MAVKEGILRGIYSHLAGLIFTRFLIVVVVVVVVVVVTMIALLNARKNTLRSFVLRKESANMWLVGARANLYNRICHLCVDLA